MDIENIFETYGMFLMIILIIKVLYYFILIINICQIEKNTREMYNNQLEEIELLKRIANALESTDLDPYIIEDEKED